MKKILDLNEKFEISLDESTSNNFELSKVSLVDYIEYFNIKSVNELNGLVKELIKQKFIKNENNEILENKIIENGKYKINLFNEKFFRIKNSYKKNNLLLTTIPNFEQESFNILVVPTTNDISYNISREYFKIVKEELEELIYYIDDTFYTPEIMYTYELPLNNLITRYELYNLFRNTNFDVVDSIYYKYKSKKDLKNAYKFRIIKNNLDMFNLVSERLQNSKPRLDLELMLYITNDIVANNYIEFNKNIKKELFAKNLIIPLHLVESIPALLDKNYDLVNNYLFLKKYKDIF